MSVLNRPMLFRRFDFEAEDMWVAVPLRWINIRDLPSMNQKTRKSA